MAATAGDVNRPISPGSLPAPTYEPIVPGERSTPGRLGWWRRVRRTRASAIVGFCALGLILFLAVAGPWISRYDPIKPDPFNITASPSGAHWMGTDQYGRDVFARVVDAARLDLMVAVAITAIALTIGAVVGGLTGYFGGIVDDVVMRVVDILLSFPAFVLAIGITAMLGNETKFVVIAVAIAYTPYFVRLVRSEMLSLREAEYAAAAKCVGNRRLRILGYHLLPNALPPALVQATLTLGWGILDTAGLSFLGVGIRPPTAEWGVLVSDGTQYINSGQWWISVFPGIAILIAVLGFNLVGEWVRDAVARR
ncbi:MAG: peptide/nickel transport system permease protein [Thermomicrobiales bacterium]|jgi:peptide/nickel transport system permease protein|nr:peptide/nickel transport system permease protein [Thermomicrobiales bacterium]